MDCVICLVDDRLTSEEGPSGLVNHVAQLTGQAEGNAHLPLMGEDRYVP